MADSEKVISKSKWYRHLHEYICKKHKYKFEARFSDLDLRPKHIGLIIYSAVKGDDGYLSRQELLDYFAKKLADVAINLPVPDNAERKSRKGNYNLFDLVVVLQFVKHLPIPAYNEMIEFFDGNKYPENEAELLRFFKYSS